MPKERDEWGSKLQFLLTCVGYAVGLGNVWRFPATAFSNGKGAFFLPYIICAFVIGFPGMFLEMSIGQFRSISANRLFGKLQKGIFSGLGWSMAVLNVLIGITYNIVIGWCLMYTFYAVTSSTEIWTNCNNSWNNGDTCFGAENISAGSKQIGKQKESASHQFFFNHILQKSDSVYDFHSFNWRMAIGIFVSTFGCALLTIKGTKSIGKSSYVTATLPYILILALLANSLFTPGGLDGISNHFFSPDFSFVLKSETWVKAGGQVCYSLSLGVANLISFSSCNEKTYNCYSDCVVVSLADFGMSLFGSLTIFSVLGILEKKAGSAGYLTLNSTANVEGGTSLAFVMYPEALMLMTFPKVWAIVFFLTLVLLGVGSFGPIMLSMATMMIDQWPALKSHRQLLVFGQAFFYFLCGCFFCFPAGFYYFDVMNTYAPGFALLLVVFLEFLCCIHIYGYVNFRANLYTMFGRPVTLLGKVFGPAGYYLKVMWLCVTPLCVFALFVFALVSQIISRAGYNDNDYEVYPTFIQIAIWIFPICTLTPLLLAGILVVWNVYRHHQGIKSAFVSDDAGHGGNRVYPDSPPTPPEFSGLPPPPKPRRAWESDTHDPSVNEPRSDEGARHIRPTLDVRPPSPIFHTRHIPFKSTLL